MSSPDNHRPDSTRSDEHLVQRARELWHEAAQHIDPATAERLRAARRQAQQTMRAPASRTVRWLVPGGAFAVIALAAMMVWQPLPQHHTTTAARTIDATDAGADLDNDLPPDADKTDPNLYQNLDFYGWLAANNHSTATR